MVGDCVRSAVSAGARFRRLTRDYERLAETLVGFHLIAVVMLMVRQFVSIGFKSA